MSETTFGRTRPATLWIGARFSVIEQLCLTSFVRLGMEPVLYCYDAVEGVPDGVEVRDAAQVLPRERVFVNEERQSYAPFSDVFRYTLLRDTGFYWVDADVYAVKPFVFEGDYFLARIAPRIGIGVLSLPKSSPSLAAVLEVAEAPRADLPWLLKAHAKVGEHLREDGTVPIEKLPYKALGPLALDWLLRHHGEMHNVLPEATHCPLLPRHILRPRPKAERLVAAADPMSVHLYGSVQHRILHENGRDEIDPKTYLGGLLQNDGFGLKLYP